MVMQTYGTDYTFTLNTTQLTKAWGHPFKLAKERCNIELFKETLHKPCGKSVELPAKSCQLLVNSFKSKLDNYLNN